MELIIYQYQIQQSVLFVLFWLTIIVPNLRENVSVHTLRVCLFCVMRLASASTRMRRLGT